MYTYYSSNAPTNDILTGMPEMLPAAAKWKRAMNYCVDTIMLYLLLMGLRSFTGWLIDDFNLSRSFAFWLQYSKSVMVNFGVYFLMMFLSEALLRGRSFGKLLTYTKAVRMDDRRFTWTDAFYRSLVRLIPIEFLSIFWGTIWHDRWTNTLVIDDHR